MDTRPRIGITCSPLRSTGYYDLYLRAIEAAGAQPVLIAPLPVPPSRDDTDRILGGIDGLVVPGGWDVAPEEYGGNRVSEMTQLDRALDQTEVALVRAAADCAMPVLGICRGQQLINVALGGSLLQHIDGHDVQGKPRSMLAHAVDVDPDSELGQVAPATLMVNSLHHQAVKDLAPGLRATAYSPDRIIEAMESADRLIVAVQSHPEELMDEAWARALFARFVARSTPRDGPPLTAARRPRLTESGEMLSLAELAAEVGRGDIDTVVVAFTDMQGRLMGKRMHAEFFVDEAQAGHPVEGCNYLLALDMEMDPIPGYEITGWERGYGDFAMVPDFSTMRRIPWLEGTALVLSDVAWNDGSPVRPSPRQVLKAQVERARQLGFEPMFGSELEFYLLKETFAEAHAKHYRDLTPSVPYILDYHILATSYDEPFIRAVRNGMHAAGIRVETSKGEAWPGQQEINFRFSDAVTMADNHTIYKNGIKEMANQHGCSVTFMAKPDHTWIGSSCHIHSSLWSDGRNAFDGEPEVFRQYLAGQLEASAELALFFAPNINSYKRYAAGSWAPTTLAWGYDNRTCAFRVVGHGQSLRIENRMPGADANPYLAFAAILAAGLHGIERGLTPPAAFEGNAYVSDVQRLSNTLRGAVSALEGGTVARGAFGDDVVDHYLNYARTEQELFDRVVTEYERNRLFERG